MELSPVGENDLAALIDLGVLLKCEKAFQRLQSSGSWRSIN